MCQALCLVTLEKINIAAFKPCVESILWMRKLKVERLWNLRERTRAMRGQSVTFFFFSLTSAFYLAHSTCTINVYCWIKVLHKYRFCGGVFLKCLLFFLFSLYNFPSLHPSVPRQGRKWRSWRLSSLGLQNLRSLWGMDSFQAENLGVAGPQMMRPQDPRGRSWEVTLDSWHLCLQGESHSQDRSSKSPMCVPSWSHTAQTWRRKFWQERRSS